MNGEFRIRAADIRDAERIFALIHLNRDQLVPRSMGNIVENIDRFTVAETEEELIGCASFVIHPEIGDIGSSTVEVQSVAVKKAFRRRGVGKALVEAVADRIRSFGPMEILVLTFAPDFFGSLGFSEISKTKVMHKLYTGCINCTKHANPFTCPEIAMIRKA